MAWGAAGAEHLKLDDFTPAEKCGACHVDIYQQWRTSAHSHAATDPIFWQFFQQATRDIPGLAGGACLSCHSPVGTVTKEIRFTEPVVSPLKLSAVANEGVTCDFCHTISGEEYFGKDISAGAYRYPRRGNTAVKYGVHADATTPDHATETSPFLQKAEFCGICHKFTHPVSGVVWQDTFAEWKNGPYAKERRRCQDCHMPEYTGTSATNSPIRSDLHAHVFPGGQNDLLKKAATVSLWAGRKQETGHDLLSIRALVSNAGSGHLMPTGIPGIRQMWVEVAVRDAAGILLSSRREDFEVQLLGGDGQPAMPWMAVKLGKDTRIAPRKSRETHFEAIMAQPSAGPLELTGTVYYRQISEKAARAIGGKASSPVVMATDRIRLFPDGRIEKFPLLSER